MKNWGSAVFPLSLMLVLAGLTFWLRVLTEMPEIKHDGKHRHDPDYIVTNATIRKLNTAGTLQYTITANDIRHFPDNDSADLLDPVFTQFKDKKNPTTMSANFGQITKGGEQAELYGDVKIYRPASAKDEEITAAMAKLTILPDDEKAYTESPVTMTKGSSWAQGIGMRFDGRAETYTLESQARALLQSSNSKKK